MKEVPEITTNADLEIGRHYHCFHRTTIEHSILTCKNDGGMDMKFFGKRIWADANNNQALERWRIYGPIDPPNIGGIYLCNKHGGYGFQTDCQRCKYISSPKQPETLDEDF